MAVFILAGPDLDEGWCLEGSSLNCGVHGV